MGAAGAFRLLQETRDRVLSLALASSFAEFGSHSRLSLPLKLHGSERIAFGAHVYAGPGCWLLTHNPDSRIEVGDGTSIAGYCVLSAATTITIGKRVLFARNVYVADHRHGFQADMPVLDQPLEDLRPISIGDGAWLGQNVVILPGVSVGAGAVIGANSVVGQDVPARSVAVGTPARVVRQLD
jgi:acetyltransferase-like isoleucine patch superfamily enzyme